MENKKEMGTQCRQNMEKQSQMNKQSTGTSNQSYQSNMQGNENARSDQKNYGDRNLQNGQQGINSMNDTQKMSQKSTEPIEAQGSNPNGNKTNTSVGNTTSGHFEKR